MRNEVNSVRKKMIEEMKRIEWGKNKKDLHCWRRRFLLVAINGGC
jgi:hypothetical protein